MNSDELIKAIVDKHEAVYSGDSSYKNTIQQMGQLNLATLDTKTVKDIIEPFLYGWGRMGRLLGRIEYSNWQEEVAENIKSNYAILRQLQQRNIEGENLIDLRGPILQLFNAFKSTVGQIGSVKILNILCPDFFPLWDTAIANAVRVEIADIQSSAFDRNIESFSGEDYFRFMESIKLFITRHNDMLAHLSNQYSQKKLRIIDECLWWTAKRPFFLMF